LLAGCCAGAILTSTYAKAQQARRGASPLALPRPGYEPRVTRIGPATLRLEVDIAALYDTNVYATSASAIDDAILHVRPRADLEWSTASTDLYAEAYADARRHLDVGRENATSFGAAFGGSAALAKAHTVRTEARFDRAIESRFDPEARAPITVPPRKIDILSSELGYKFTGARFGVDLTGGVQRFSYLDPAERDRDLRIYRGSARVSWQPAAPVAFYLETYVNRRDFNLATDLNGVDRDATTLGVLLGVSREVTAKLRGRIGAGVFRADPDDPGLPGFTGLAANGEIIWSPRPRTQITAAVFRGDVATVRAGATGRTDTRASVRIDQEARHNLLLHGVASWTRNDFRGLVANQQDTFGAEVEAEYLINRTFSAFAGASFAQRNSDRPLDEFSKGRFQIGVRIRR
jgi:hypothetical protein